MAYFKCPSCGNFVDEAYNFCPNCGAPISLSTPEKPRTRPKIFRYILLLLVIGAAIWGYKQYTIYNYRIDLHNAIYYSAESAGKTEDAGILLISVWNNAYYRLEDEKTDKYTLDENGRFLDYQDARAAAIDSKEYSSAMKKAEENLQEAMSLMGNLTNPPKQYEEAYQQVKKFYTDCWEFYDFILHPTGDIEEYYKQFDEMRQGLVKQTYSLSVY